MKKNQGQEPDKEVKEEETHVAKPLKQQRHFKERGCQWLFRKFRLPLSCHYHYLASGSCGSRRDLF
jgi:hypothetical protein